MTLIWFGIAVFGGVALGLIPYFLRPENSHRKEIADFSATILAVVLVLVTLGLSSQQLRTAQQAEQTAHYSRLVDAMSKGRESRLLALQGFSDYTESYPETRVEILRQLAAHTRSVDRKLESATRGSDKSVTADLIDEAAITLGILRDVSAMTERPSQSLTYDLANVDLRGATTMTGMVAESGWFHGTLFNVELKNARFTCGSLEESRFAGDLTGTRFEGVNISGANFLDAIEIEAATFDRVFWDAKDPPKWDPSQWRNQNPPSNRDHLAESECKRTYGLE